MLKCEFHVPISPTPDFLWRVRYLAGSIRLYSGLHEDEYRIVVTVGDKERTDLEAICPWTREFPLEWRWVPPQRFDRWWYFATAYERYRYDYAAETVVMLDGDVLVTGRLTDAIDHVRDSARFAAVPALFSPFFIGQDQADSRSPVESWTRIFELAQVQVPAFDMEHPAWDVMKARQPRHVEQLRFSPPYPNAGVVVASANTARRIGEHIFADIDIVNSVSRSAVTGQVALTLAIHRLGLEWAPLAMRFNFQNLPWVFDAYPEDRNDVRVLHFLNGAEIDRVRDFKSRDDIERLFHRPELHPVNRFFVERLRTVHDRVVAPS